MVAIDGGPVAPHVQAFADEANRRFGFTHILTYPGHEPDQQHALDNFGPQPNPREKMLELATFCTRDDVIDHFGIDYVIFDVYQQSNAGEIYNREIARYWRTMADRGGITANHHDHCHVSFNKTGSTTAFGGIVTPIPKPKIEEDVVFIVGTPGSQGQYLVTGSAVFALVDGNFAKQLVESGVKSYSVSRDQFNHIESVAR